MSETAMPALNWLSDTPEAMRQAYNTARAALACDFPADVDQFTLQEPRLSGLRFVPHGGGQGAPVLYFHGGGWVIGSPETHRVLCAWMARLSGREVISVRYRLAPEHVFPAQPQDAIAALGAMIESRGACFVAGDSAGAAMALWAESGIAVSQRPSVLGVVGLYGAFGLSDSRSMQTNAAANPGLGKSEIHAIYRFLGLSDPLEIQDWISTLGAPVLLIRAGGDTLADDSDAGAALLKDRVVSLVDVPQQPHAFLQNVGHDPIARHEMERVAAWMAALESHPLQR